MDRAHAGALVAVIALVTAFLRFLPFLIWGGEKKTPDYIVYLGRVLPYAIMGMLVVYCLKGVSLTAAPHGIPEFLAVVSVALLYLWKKNTLLSIALGTAFYMFLVQVVF